ncbi:HNH endonuclease [Streptomyces sp. NPDC058471]|uniref:HNH endonuclease n=1 Tax=Streptomyces sp. NPDC058471 TaxID=3346516 RepID=UPI00364D2290
MNEAQRAWPRPKSLPGPLGAALNLLQEHGCALACFDLTRPELLDGLGETASEAALQTLAQLNAWHPVLAAMPPDARKPLLQDAHVVPWQESRAGCTSEAAARRRFNHWRNILVLCSTCHGIYDNSRLIPRQLVVEARLAVLRTDVGRRALELYLERSLAFRNGRQCGPFETDEAWAAYELYRLHGHGGEISVKPHLKQDRHFQSTLSPEDGLIRVGPYGGDTDSFHFAYTITDVPPPAPGVYRLDPPASS